MNTQPKAATDSARHAGNAPSEPGERASGIEIVKLDLLNYFATIGAAPDRVFTISDFNSQVMMNAYSPRARARLGYALAELVDAGVLRRSTATCYLLTSAGQALVRTKRLERASRRQVAPARSLC
jgi:hypothetical protein